MKNDCFFAGIFIFKDAKKPERIEGSSLTHDQTRYIFETNTIGVENKTLNVDDVIETANHF